MVGNTLLRSALSRITRSVPDEVGDIGVAAANNKRLEGRKTHQLAGSAAGAHLADHLHTAGIAYGRSAKPVSLHTVQEALVKLEDPHYKLEHELATVGQDMAYFRHLLEYQNQKIEKLTGLLIDVLHGKNVHEIQRQLQQLQGDGFGSLAAAHVADDVADVAIPSLRSLGLPDIAEAAVAGVQIDADVESQLHHVARAAVDPAPSPKSDISEPSRKRPLQRRPDSQQLSPQELRQKLGLQLPTPQQSHPSRKSSPSPEALPLINSHRLPLAASQRNPSLSPHLAHENGVSLPARKLHPLPQFAPSGRVIPGLEAIVGRIGGPKRPKIGYDFLHTHMTIAEIYEEYTKGFRGQPPLREMDERYGKHEWRGHSRSKESKRYQRRKRLCDAIEHGMKKYDKSADDIIRYIESFRGDKSLTWVMNGNLPDDLLTDASKRF